MLHIILGVSASETPMAEDKLRAVRDRYFVSKNFFKKARQMSLS